MCNLFRSQHQGQSIVEMVLLLPILFMMLLAMVDFSLAFNAHTKLRNAVAEGGYWAAQNPGDLDGVRDQIHMALQDLEPPITNSDIDITPCVLVSGDYETAITVRYTFPVIFGLFGTGAGIPLTNSTTIPQFGGCR